MNFDDFIKDKKVLLLGPAPYLYENDYDEDLNDYDVVVKINRMVETEICKDFKNDRCDILYHCIDVAPQYGMFQYDLEFISKKVKHLRIPYPSINHYYKNNIMKFTKLNQKINLPFSITPEDVYLNLYKKCGNTSPNTGTIAICDILNNKPKTLTIRGITMFDGGYNKKYRTKITSEEEVEELNSIVKNHNTNKQRNYLKKVLKENDNLDIDQQFLKGLEIK